MTAQKALTIDGLETVYDALANAIDQAVTLLQKFSAGEGLTDTDPDVFDHSDATALLTSGLIAIAEQLRRIADVMETRTL